MMIFYKFGGLEHPGKYRNILLKDQSFKIAKILEFAFFNVSFDPIFIMIKVDLFSIQYTHMMISYIFGGLEHPGKYRNILLKDQSFNIAKYGGSRFSMYF